SVTATILLGVLAATIRGSSTLPRQTLCGLPGTTHQRRRPTAPITYLFSCHGVTAGHDRLCGLCVQRLRGTLGVLMRIAVLGAGGVGGYFGGRLAACGSDVVFVARGAHLEALRARGLRLESPKGDLHVHRVAATDDPGTIGPVGAVLFAVKLYDVESAAAMLPPLIGPDTIVVPLQNGVDAVGMLTQAIGRQHVGGGVAYVAAVVTEPGVIRHTAMDHLIFGELDGARSP